MSRWIHSKTFRFIKATSLTVFFFGVVFCLPFLFTGQVHAQDTLGLQPIEDTIALSGTDIRVIVARIIRAVLGLLGTILLGIMVYAGGLWMTSAGKEETIGKAKKIISNAIIGLVIILSSLAIVQFVISSLLSATSRQGLDGGRRPGFETFAGSGSLGSIISDHYPFRNATDIKRNTKIAVTFIEPINPESIIINSNDSCWTENGGSTREGCQLDGDNNIINPYYGDCLDDGSGAFICDTLDTSAVRILRSSDANLAEVPLVNANAMTMYEDGDARHAYTFVFDPQELLGSREEDMWYTVNLLNTIKRKDGDGAFDDSRSGYYKWEFKTGTEEDVDPPHVVSVYPREDGVGYKNSIVQITFDEAMDPTAVQGMSGADTSFHNIIFHDTVVEGEWRITNGYRTVSFVSDEACGMNSCGDVMYCLPTDCGESGCVDNYGVLIRTASLIDRESGEFEAIPFSGVMDMSSNALDSRSGSVIGGDNVIQLKPSIDDNKVIGEEEKVPDNAFWAFDIRNEIDRTPPHIQTISPDIDTGGVVGRAEVLITFSEEMWYSTLRDIGIEEYPIQPDLDTMWTSSRANRGENNTTVTEMKHREFGPNGLDLYYFPYIPSDVKDAQQNCFYPGVGPVHEGVSCLTGDLNDPDCTALSLESDEDTACVTKNREEILKQPTTLDCRATLQRADISPI
jgi:hypothetical protein